MAKTPPRFWWEFSPDKNAIIVQSDWPGGEQLDLFEAPEGQRHLEPQIDMAKTRIADYIAGRATPKWSASGADIRTQGSNRCKSM